MSKVTNAELKQIITTNTATTNSNFQKAKQAIDGKVSKETGKGLSTNDFTDALQTKLNGIAEGADVSTIKGVQVNSSDLTPDANGKVNVQIPAAVSYTIGESASTTSGMLKTYVLKADGVEIAGSKIDIPKDYLLKSATVEVCTTANTPLSGLAVGDPYADLVFNTKDNLTSTGDTHQYVNLKGLVDIYTAGTGIIVSNSNVISIDTNVVAQKSDLPTKTSDLTDDMLTGYEKASSAAALSASDSVKVALGKLEKALDGKQASGSYAPASHSHTKSEITDFPTNISAFTNDAGYLTQHQDVSDKCDADDVRDIINAVIGDMLITAWDNITIS